MYDVEYAMLSMLTVLFRNTIMSIVSVVSIVDLHLVEVYLKCMMGRFIVHNTII